VRQSLSLFVARLPAIRVLVVEGLRVALIVVRVAEQVLVIQAGSVMLFHADDLAAMVLAGGIQPALHAAGSQIVARRQLGKRLHDGRALLRQIVQRVTLGVAHWKHDKARERPIDRDQAHQLAI